MQSPRNQKEEEATKKKTLGGFSKLRLLRLRLLLLLSRPSLYPAPGERGKETKERESLCEGE